MSKTIIISNRLPIQLEIDKNEIKATPSIGGLATGMKSVHRDGNGIWIGWSGLNNEELTPDLQKKIDFELEKQQCKSVNLSKEEVDGFYYGFSNKTIWPLFHYFMEYAEFDTNDWETYKKVNAKFADKVLENIEEGDSVWIHDYQLLLLPQYIKEKRPDICVGFFLHIPFPSFEVFRTLPWREELLEGMLGADLLGFHTYEYERHFLSSVQRILGYNSNFNNIILEDREVKVDSFPMGIDYEKFSTSAKLNKHLSEKDKSNIQIEIDRHLNNDDDDTKLILSIDRLDYTKGIPNRLLAFEYFLEKYPEYKGKVRLVMLAVPSRSNVPQYKLLKNEVDQLVGRINGKYSEINWTPIWYFYRSLPYDNLIDLYTSCDIALLTPLRDGMNLVAKEYIACREDQTGVLILSEMTGASQEMSESLLINPNDFQKVADTLKQAIEMPKEEQISRNKTLQKRLQRYNVDRWAKDFMEALKGTSELNEVEKIKKLNFKRKEKLIDSFKKAEKRILFFDYDGTLAPFEKLPENAKPTPELFEVLDKIDNDENTDLVLITGRDKETFNKWFGHKNYKLITEHGAWFKDRDKDWIMLEALTNNWFGAILPILESFMDRTPGALIEEKVYSLAWHYRNSDPDLGQRRANQLVSTIEGLISNHNLEILEGDKVIEIKVSGVNKGRSANKLLLGKNYDFIFAIGDDLTDEHMFEELPEQTYTVKVGLKKTVANYYVEGTKQVRKLLECFAKK